MHTRDYYKKKASWKLLNSLLSNKPKSNSIPSINIDGKEISDKREIAETFNEYFSTIGSNLAKQVPPTIYKQYIKCTKHRFSLLPVSSALVQDLISSLDTKKSIGVDNIPAQILKDTCDIIAPQLTFIFNLCINSGQFVDDWKIARVTPIFKKGSKSDLNNHRPVSVLPVLSKSFEKIVFDQLYDYLNSNNLLEENQSGFRPSFSTATCLLKQMNDWLRNIDNGLIVMLWSKLTFQRHLTQWTATAY